MVKPLIHNTSFPLKDEALSWFQALKNELAEVSLGVINEDIPFVVEIDASENLPSSQWDSVLPEALHSVPSSLQPLPPA